MKKILMVVIAIVLISVLFCGCGESHKNCGVVGYANLDFPLSEHTILYRTPQYGYKAVYVDPTDPNSPNFKYHFH